MRLSYTELEKRFLSKYPNGQITKAEKNTYYVFFNSIDTRSEAERELQEWGKVTDKRKMYTYKASSLQDLGYKLKLDLSDIEEEQKKKSLNYDPEVLEIMNTDYSDELFG